jgi:hypothetical protein
MAPSPYRENAAAPVARRATWWSTRRAVDIATVFAAAGAVASFALHTASFDSRLTLADPTSQGRSAMRRTTVDPSPRSPSAQPVTATMPIRRDLAGAEGDPLTSQSYLSALQTESVVVANFVALREACWAPMIPVHFKVRIQTEDYGHVTGADLTEVQWDAPEPDGATENLGACLEHEIREWRYPSSWPGGSTFTTEMTFGDYGDAPRLKSLPY